jgi:hypothetical protein
MADVFITTLNDAPAGAFTTRNKALAFCDLLRSQFPSSRVGVQEFTANELDSIVSGSLKLYTVTFPNIQSVSNAEIREGSPIRGSIEENLFSYNAVTKEFRILVWAADETAAGQEGNTRRQAFITLIGAENL